MIEATDKTDVPAETKSGSTFQFYTVRDNDNELELEDWMTKDYYFELPLFQEVNDTDYRLGLGGWSLNEKLLGSEKVNDEPVGQKSWMTSGEGWNS
jgi:hypothetical protein